MKFHKDSIPTYGVHGSRTVVDDSLAGSLELENVPALEVQGFTAFLSGVAVHLLF
jgi:hypothetical protein